MVVVLVLFFDRMLNFQLSMFKFTVAMCFTLEI